MLPKEILLVSNLAFVGNAANQTIIMTAIRNISIK